MRECILHILADDKFTDYAVSQFRCLDVKCDFVLIETEGWSENIKSLKHVETMKAGTSQYEALLGRLKLYKAIILHGLFWKYDSDILSKIFDTKIKIAWVNWGGEIYGRKDVYYDFLAPVEKALEWTHSIVKKIKGDIPSHYEVPLPLFNRIDYCLSDEFEEYQYAAKYLSNNRISYLWYNYYTLEDMVGGLIDKRCHGDSVFMGNCAANECNYYEVMPKLKFLKSKGQKVYIPLGYGAPWVKNRVVRLGKLLYGKCFCPLLEFLERELYNEILLDCSTLIMPHYAPRAQGNIITALWLGMRVYLSEKNMTYHYFNRLGCTVYSIERDFKESNPHRFDPMSDEELIINREILSSVYSKESTLKGIQHIVNVLMDNEN